MLVVICIVALIIYAITNSFVLVIFGIGAAAFFVRILMFRSGKQKQYEHSKSNFKEKRIPKRMTLRESWKYYYLNNEKAEKFNERREKGLCGYCDSKTNILSRRCKSCGKILTKWYVDDRGTEYNSSGWWTTDIDGKKRLYIVSWMAEDIFRNAAGGVIAYDGLPASYGIPSFSYLPRGFSLNDITDREYWTITYPKEIERAYGYDNLMKDLAKSDNTKWK